MFLEGCLKIHINSSKTEKCHHHELLEVSQLGHDKNVCN